MTGNIQASRNDRGLLIALVGPAGAGKTTLAHRLLQLAPDQRAFSVSHTTRTQRAGEQHGVDYYFVPRAEFEALRDAGGFVESAEVHGNLYGTSVGEIERLRAAGRDVLFDIDIQGALNIWRQFPEATRLAFVLPPGWPVLVERLRARGTETDDTVRRRLRTARQELQALIRSPAPWHIVLNDTLDNATSALAPLFAAEPPPPTVPGDHPAVLAFLRGALADPRAA